MKSSVAFHTCRKAIVSFVMLFTLTILVAAPCFFANQAHAAQTTLAWDPPVNADGTPVQGISGYKIHFGTASGNYSDTIDAGNVTSYTLSGLTDGTTYYFAATDYDSAGNESTDSNEISRTFPFVYTITATAGAGGSIVPINNTSGGQATNGSSTVTTINVTQGASQSISITPNAGYIIANVTVDGVSVGAVASYTFNNVVTNHTMTATFVATNYTISATAGTNGSITPSGSASVSYGASQTYSIAPAAGYAIATVAVDGVSVGAVASYTFNNVVANHTISASFSAITTTYTISATAGTGGSITPAGSTTVTSGTGQAYSIVPATGYAIADVKVDGISVGTVASYSFSNVVANHTIAASFSAVTATYTISATAGIGGSISPSGATTLNYGASQTYTITPATGYKVAGVAVDGVSVGAVSSYTFSTVAASHSITASFASTSVITSGTGTWVNKSIVAQYGTFTASFDLVPSANNINSVTGLSAATPSAYTDLAAIVRFNPSGAIDVMNGVGYAANVVMPYSAGKIYHVRMQINIPKHQYDVYVTPQGGTETRLASAYAFRSTQATVSVLKKIDLYSAVGSTKLQNLSITTP